MESVTSRPIILYAEDDQDDFESVREAMLQITDRFSQQIACNWSLILYMTGLKGIIQHFTLIAQRQKQTSCIRPSAERSTGQ